MPVGLQSVQAFWSPHPNEEDGEPFAGFNLGIGILFNNVGNYDPFTLVAGQYKASSTAGVSNLPAFEWEGGDALEQYMRVDGDWYEYDDDDEEWVPYEGVLPPNAANFDMWVQDGPGCFPGNGPVNYAFRQQGGVRQIGQNTDLILQPQAMTGTVTGTYPNFVYGLP